MMFLRKESDIPETHAYLRTCMNCDDHDKGCTPSEVPCLQWKKRKFTKSISVNLIITCLMEAKSPFSSNITYYIIVNRGAHQVSKICYDHLRQKHFKQKRETKTKEITIAEEKAKDSCSADPHECGWYKNGICTSLRYNTKACPNDTQMFDKNSKALDSISDDTYTEFIYKILESDEDNESKYEMLTVFINKNFEVRQIEGPDGKPEPRTYRKTMFPIGAEHLKMIINGLRKGFATNLRIIFDKDKLDPFRDVIKGDFGENEHGEPITTKIDYKKWFNQVLRECNKLIKKYEITEDSRNDEDKSIAIGANETIRCSKCQMILVMKDDIFCPCCTLTIESHEVLLKDQTREIIEALRECEDVYDTLDCLEVKYGLVEKKEFEFPLNKKYITVYKCLREMDGEVCGRPLWFNKEGTKLKCMRCGLIHRFNATTKEIIIAEEDEQEV